MTIDQELLEFAHALADAAREVLRGYGGGLPKVHVKPDGSPVTDADRAIEDRLRAMITDRFPDHGIIGEERGRLNPGAAHVWVLDPIDGTKQFIAGLPHFGTLIGLARDGAPVLGVIDHPATDERWLGARGAPTVRNGAPVQSRACPDLGAAILACGSPDRFGPASRPLIERLKSRTRWTIYGGSCYTFAQLASGRVDLIVDEDLDLVDLWALAPVIEGAGGAITDWRGRPLTLDLTGQVLAAGDRRLHAAALEVIAGAAKT